MINEITSLGIDRKTAEELIKVSKNIEKDIKLLKKGYPIQYLIGYTNFYGYDIIVNKDVLIPRFETEYLVDLTIQYLKKYGFNNPKTLDLCTGSGCISLALYKEGVSNNITASDISLKALKVANKNFKENNIKVNTIQSNLFENINEKYDLIIANPPYVSINERLSKVVLKEPHLALFSDNNGTSHIEKIIKNFSKFTNNKAILALETNSYTKKELKSILNKYNLDNYIFKKDLTNKDRYIFITKNYQ